MSNKRTAKNITNKNDIDYLINITSEDAAKRSTIMECFADFGDGPRFNPYDVVGIPKGSYGKSKKNKNDFTTTVGLWIINKGWVEPLSDQLGYNNKTIDAKVYGAINQDLSYMCLEDEVSVDEFKKFIMQTQVYMSCASAVCPSYTREMMLITNDIEAHKAKLEKKYAEAIKKKDLVQVAEMQKELMDFAKDKLKDDPSADMYNSGAGADWGNNFKNMYIMKGAVRKTDGTYDIIESSYMSGLKPEEFSKTNDAAVGGPFSRAVNTSKGGDKEKQFVQALQHIIVGKAGTDCGSKETIEVNLDAKNINDFMYCFVLDRGGLTEITSKNKSKFIGKTVRLRFSSLCKSKGYICEKCAGTLFRRLGKEAVGVATYQMMSKVKNVSMKSFHNSNVDLYTIDVDRAFGYR